MSKTTDTTKTKTKPSTVEEARQRVQQARDDLAELERLVITGEDLDADDLIPEAERAVESAIRICKGVERRAHEAAAKDWTAKRDELREKVSAARDRDEKARAKAEAEAIDALKLYIAVVDETATSDRGRKQAVSQLEAEASRLGLDGMSVHINTGPGAEFSPVFSAVQVATEALKGTTVTKRQERRLSEFLAACLAKPDASFESVARGFVGTPR